MAAQAQTAQNGNNDGSIIDVMVVYTPVALNKEGGKDKIEKWIDEAVLSTNLALRNSGVDLRIDLVYVGQVSYTEIDDNTDLDNLTNGAKGLESIAKLRDAYHADVVLLITNNPKMEGGKAQTIMSLSGDHACARFCVVRSGVTSVFVHEFGHIIGAQHDKKENGQFIKGIFPYAHGFTGDNYTPNTIVGGFVEGVKGIGKVNFYSNPDLIFRNAPLGDKATGDNRRTFNETAPTIAKCRDSEVTWTGAVNSNWDNPNNWSTSRVPRSFDDVLIPGGVSSYPVIGSGAANARNLLVQSAATLKMSAGQLFVRGYFKADGIFTATGGTVTLNNDLDKALPLTLNKESYFNDLLIGDGNTHTWAQLKSGLKVNGSLTIEKGAILDPAGQSISVNGDWNDNSNGFNYINSVVTVTRKANIKTTQIEYQIPPDAEGYYSPELVGWSTMAEFGNYGPNWKFGGKEGYTWLSTKNYYQDNPDIMDAIDSWLFMPTTVLQAGIKYQFAFEYKTDSEPRKVSVHYGNVQLPSLMKNAGISKDIPADDNWVIVSGEMEMSETGTYNIGIRSYNAKDNNLANSYIRNIKLTPISNAPATFPTPPPKPSPSPPQLPKPPGFANLPMQVDIAVGGDNSVWAAGGGGKIRKFDSQNQKWIDVPGNAVRISVADDGTPWIITAQNEVQNLKDPQNPTSNWSTITFLATGEVWANDIAAHTNTDFWIITTRQATKREIVRGGMQIGPQDYKILHYTLENNNWEGQTFPGGGVAIAVDNSGRPWVVTAQGRVYRHPAPGNFWGKWEEIKNEDFQNVKAQDIAISPSSSRFVYILGQNGRLYEAYYDKESNMKEADSGISDFDKKNSAYVSQKEPYHENAQANSRVAVGTYYGIGYDIPWVIKPDGTIYVWAWWEAGKVGWNVFPPSWLTK